MQAAAAIPAAFPDEPNDVPMECRGRTQSFERRRSLHDLHHMHESEPDGKKQPKSWSCWESNPGGQKFRMDPLCGSLKIWNAKPLHHTTSLVPAGWSCASYIAIPRAVRGKSAIQSGGLLREIHDDQRSSFKSLLLPLFCDACAGNGRRNRGCRSEQAAGRAAEAGEPGMTWHGGMEAMRTYTCVDFGRLIASAQRCRIVPSFKRSRFSNQSSRHYLRTL